MKSFSELMTGVRRGFTRHCPNCGVGKVFVGYLTVAQSCSHCALDLQQYPSDDVPPYATIFIVGHLLIPTALLVDRSWPLVEWLQITLWASLAALLTLTLLPFVKGAVIGFEWAMGIVRQEGPDELIPAKRP